MPWRLCLGCGVLVRDARYCPAGAPTSATRCESQGGSGKASPAPVGRARSGKRCEALEGGRRCLVRGAANLQCITCAPVSRDELEVAAVNLGAMIRSIARCVAQ